MSRRLGPQVGRGTLWVLVSGILLAGFTVIASPSSAGAPSASGSTFESAARVTVSGQVTDGSGHGWPMYAKIAAPGSQTTTFTDPVTGRYTIELPAENSHILEVEPQYPGYGAASRRLDVGSVDLTVDLELSVDNCEAAPGYRRPRVGTLGDNGGLIGDFLDSRAIRSDELSFWHEDPSLYDVIVVNDPGDPTRDNFLQFLAETDAAGTGVVFLDTRPTTAFAGTGISLLSKYVGNPSSRNIGTGEEIPYLSYHVTQEHPVMAGFEVGDEVVFDETSTSKVHGWFGGYEGEGRTAVANAARADTGVLGSGIGVQERANNRHVLLSMHGAQSFEPTGPDNWTPDAAEVFVNALEWAAAETSLDCRPVNGGLVVGNVTDLNTGAGLANATVTDVDNPSGSAVRSSIVEGDSAHGQGFHWRFVPQTGSKSFNVSLSRYVDVTTTIEVRPDTVNEADFALPAGRIDISPGSLDALLRIGQEPQQHDFTITNTGTAPVKVELTERRGVIEALASDQQPAEVRDVPGHFTPEAALPRVQQEDSQPGVHAGASAAPWTDLPSYPHPVQDNSAAVIDDTVYSFGGTDGSASLADAYSFDPVTGRWDPIAAMPADRMKPEAVEYDGLIYILGGWSADGLTNRSVFVYDPATDTYSPAAPMPAGRAAPGAAVVGGKIYVVGGCANILCTPSNAVWRYDPATDSWETLANYPETVSWLGCAGLQGRIYCAGGIGSADDASASTYEYDPATSTWSRRADMPYDNWGMSYAAASDQFVVSGGVTLGRRIVTNRGAAYDAAADRWTEIEPSNRALFRAGGACGFYRIGGLRGGPTSNVEVHIGFDGCPATTDVPWLTVTPQTITLRPGEQVRATVRLDATMDQPGTHTAGVAIRHDTPYPVTPVSVTATVNPPNSWGKLTGTVTGVDCLGNERPLAGAVVRINHEQGGVTRLTDSDGSYSYWLSASHNPLTVVVSSDPSHVPQSRTVRIAARKAVVGDFVLQRICGSGGTAQPS